MAFLRSPEPTAVARRSRYLLGDRGNKLVRFALIFTFILFLPHLCLPQTEPPASNVDPHKLEGKRTEVRIIARGSSTASSTGNMDIYLAAISQGGHGEPVVARLVYYYPFFATGLSDERMTSGRPFHLRLSYADYCGMEIKDFVVHQVFDQDALSKLQDGQAALPCYLIRP